MEIKKNTLGFVILKTIKKQFKKQKGRIYALDKNMYEIRTVGNENFIYKDNKSVTGRFKCGALSGMKNIIEESFGKDFYYFKNEVTEGLVQNINQYIMNKKGLQCFMLDKNHQLIPAIIEYSSYEKQSNKVARVDYQVHFPDGGSDKEIILSGFGFYSLQQIKKAEQEAIVWDLNKLEKTSNESNIKLAFVKDIFKDIDFSTKEKKTKVGSESC